MNAIDRAALVQLSKGDGEMRVTKRLMRGILADLASHEAADRAQAIIGRKIGSAIA